MRGLTQYAPHGTITGIALWGVGGGGGENPETAVTLAQFSQKPEKM